MTEVFLVLSVKTKKRMGIAEDALLHQLSQLCSRAMKHVKENNQNCIHQDHSYLFSKSNKYSNNTSNITKREFMTFTVFGKLS